MSKQFTILIVIILVLVGGWLIFNNSNLNVDLPSGDSQKISININGMSEDILETDGVKHSVPLNEIIGGGPAKDGIPSIDDPKFTEIEESNEWLNDDEVGIAVMVGEVNRFYPFQILVYHEIVNDVINGQRVLVTYCPLCRSGLVFDPLVQGERVEFGTSGKLWNSNLVMYDRKTDSLWSQALGESIVGEETGSFLEVLNFDQLKYGDWKAEYPNGQVLSKDTGALKFYGSDPYGDYYTTPGVYFSLNNEDDRLKQKDLILGLEINEQTKAYLPEAIKKVGILEDELGGTKLSIEYDTEIDSVRIYKISSNDSRERINPFPMFWFAWVAIHPDTELYK